MIPSAFEYEAPTSTAEAVELLAGAPMGAKILAGGQSFIPVLRLRMADPELVVGLAKIPGLDGARLDGDHLVIGAMTTHAAAASDPLVL